MFKSHALTALTLLSLASTAEAYGGDPRQDRRVRQPRMGFCSIDAMVQYRSWAIGIGGGQGRGRGVIRCNMNNQFIEELPIFIETSNLQFGIGSERVEYRLIAAGLQLMSGGPHAFTGNYGQFQMGGQLGRVGGGEIGIAGTINGNGFSIPATIIGKHGRGFMAAVKIGGMRIFPDPEVYGAPRGGPVWGRPEAPPMGGKFGGKGRFGQLGQQQDYVEQDQYVEQQDFGQQLDAPPMPQPKYSQPSKIQQQQPSKYFPPPSKIPQPKYVPQQKYAPPSQLPAPKYIPPVTQIPVKKRTGTTQTLPVPGDKIIAIGPKGGSKVQPLPDQQVDPKQDRQIPPQVDQEPIQPGPQPTEPNDDPNLDPDLEPLPEDSGGAVDPAEVGDLPEPIGD